MSPRRRLSTLKRVLFAMTLLLALLAAAEGACRVRAAVRAAGKPAPAALVPDAYRPVVLRPGRHEVHGRVAMVNQLGMRGPEVGPKRPGVRRILCVGASSTYGLYVARDADTWPARLEARLEGAGHAVEVLNAGTPSWDVRASQTNLELRLYALRPDVIVVLHGYNDVVANRQPGYEADSHAEDVAALWRPYRHSALVAWLLQKVTRPDLVLKHKLPRLERPGVEAFARNLRRMVRRGREEGAQVVLCTEPMPCPPTQAAARAMQVPDVALWFERHSPFPYEVLHAGMSTYHAVVRRVAEEERAPLVDLERLLPDDLALFASPIHHTALGSEVVARLVADRLERAGLLGPEAVADRSSPP